MSEQQIQKKIIDYLNRIGAYSVKTITVNRAGTPDILACLNGKFIAIEVKRLGKKATPLQEHHINEIKKAGGIAFVACSVDEVKQGLEELI